MERSHTSPSSIPASHPAPPIPIDAAKPTCHRHVMSSIATHGITRIEAVMTDNDLVFTMRFAYYRQRRTRFEQACQSLGIAHRRLRPHAPESNGKVERFIKTIDDECLAALLTEVIPAGDATRLQPGMPGATLARARTRAVCAAPPARRRRTASARC